MSRFVGMIIALVGLAVALVVLGWVGYLAAGGLAYAFAAWGLVPQYGAAIANLLILLLVVVMVSASLLSVAERKWSALIQDRIGANRITVAGTALGEFKWDSLPSAGKRFGIVPLAAGTVDGRLAGNRDRVPAETGEDYRRASARTS